VSDNLKTPAGLVEAVIADFDELLAAFQVCDLPDALEARAVLATASMGLGQCREQLDTLIGDAMGTYRVVVDGFGFVERHHKKSRTKWDRDALLSAVRDTRLVDPETGEVIDPTPLDKVLHVWNLGAPRLGALKERGIDADEFCETEERKGWQLKV
jgi:hypothetical protein